MSNCWQTVSTTWPTVDRVVHLPQNGAIDFDPQPHETGTCLAEGPRAAGVLGEQMGACHGWLTLENTCPELLSSERRASAPILQPLKLDS